MTTGSGDFGSGESGPVESGDGAGSSAGIRLPGPIPIPPDPPAPGTLPPTGVPFSGPERVRADPGLDLKWLLVVLAIMAVGMVITGFGSWQVGACVVGGGMIVGALVRAILPSDKVGLLRVRTKPADATWMLLVGVGIIVMVLSRLGSDLGPLIRSTFTPG